MCIRDRAQGVFFGMTTMHKREHFLRAVLEGVAFSLSQITGVLRERQTIDRMQIIGGGAHSKLWKQIIADVCDVTLQDVSIFSDNATSLGEMCIRDRTSWRNSQKRTKPDPIPSPRRSNLRG